MHTIARRTAAAASLAALGSLALAVSTLGQPDAVIVISDTLEPARLEVAQGTVVTWRNDDGERHRVRSRQGPVAFDSGNLEPGERFSVTFVAAGEYPYLDERNDDDPAYFGTVIVTATEEPAGPLPLSGTITLVDESFQPSRLEVEVGATVTWENIDGDDDHTVTSTSGAFDSGILAAGAAFEHTFDTPGAYDYFCAIHPEMTGAISVVDSSPPPEDGAAVEAPEAVASPAPEAAAEVDQAAAQADAAVSIVGVAFEPADIEVRAGSTVTWTNDDPFEHTVTATEGAFDSGVMAAGAVFSQAFDTPGSYDYLCAIHPSMIGTVTVTASDGG